jgi:hypothetical protein
VILLFTAVGNFLTLEAEACIAEWRAQYHIVEQMPIQRVAPYLHIDPASALALVDAIVCMADMEFVHPTLDFPVHKALALARDVRNLPESCTMSDGRKWKSIPFVIFCGGFTSGTVLLTKNKEHAHLCPSTHPFEALHLIQRIVDEYHDLVLRDYENLGILVRFKKGHAQIGPALKRKDPRAESEYYFAQGDRRKNTGWVTVKRDSEGLRQDVELFQVLLDRGVGETDMHRFFEEHPAILMEARLGIPISHQPNFARPKDHKPDFSLSPILGPQPDKMIELLELKSPTEKTLTRGLHRDFTAKVHHAVAQVRDYGCFLRDSANFNAVFRAFGYVPDNSNHAVLIGRASKNTGDAEAWIRRQSELNVEIITYDEILETQANQLRGPYTLRYGTPGYPADEPRLSKSHRTKRKPN